MYTIYNIHTYYIRVSNVATTAYFEEGAYHTCFFKSSSIMFYFTLTSLLPSTNKSRNILKYILYVTKHVNPFSILSFIFTISILKLCINNTKILVNETNKK